MGSDPLWAGPSGATEGTFALLIVLVSNMPHQFLRSWVHFATNGTEIRPSLGNLSTFFGIPCDPSVSIESIRLGH